MTKFYIIARVNGTEYLTKIEAETACQAEHIALDRGIYNAGEYGCDACMAYDAKAMKTDTFIGAAMWAEPISVDGLMQKIDENNARLTAKAARLESIRVKEAAIKAAEESIKSLREQIEAAKAELKNL